MEEVSQTYTHSVQFSSVQPLSHVRLFGNLWTAECQASLSITNSQSLLRLMSIESVMPSNHLLCCPLLLLPSIFPSIRVFSNGSVLCIRWPKYWSFSFSTRLVRSLFCPRHSQESSPSPQFESIYSLVLSLFYSPTLTSVYDYQKNQSFDYMDL